MIAYNDEKHKTSDFTSPQPSVAEGISEEKYTSNVQNRLIGEGNHLKSVTTAERCNSISVGVFVECATEENTVAKYAARAAEKSVIVAWQRNAACRN